jgi:anaerobic selenocysteine-containing dehydrogenase
MSTDEMIEALFTNATGTAARTDHRSVRHAGPIKAAPDPGPQRFATPSGRIEFYSETLANTGQPPMPDWMDEEATVDHRWPLRLLTAPGYFLSHTVFSGNPVLRRREGVPICVLHPEDAAARELHDGDEVELVNDLGVVRMRLVVSDETPAGMALVPGQRSAAEASGTTINTICADALSDLGEGATYQSTRLEVRRAR